ncbi:MAG: AsmA family protein [Agarilytica sp.]
MKTIKIFLTIIVLLAALIAGVVFYIFNNINQLVKEAVETHGPSVTQTQVELRDVDIKLIEGSGELNNFVVRNPKGFSDEHILRWDKIGIAIDPASIKTDVIHLTNVAIEGVNIRVEEKNFKTNVQALLKNLPKEESASSGSGGSVAENEPSTEPLLALKHLSFKNNSIDLITEKFGSVSLEIPSFELHDLGSPESGLTPEELGKAILEPLLKRAQKSVEKRILDLAAGDLDEKLKEKKEELEQELEEKKDSLKQDVGDKKEELKEDLEEKRKSLKEKADEQEDKLKDKRDELKQDAKDKLNNLFNR